MIFRVSTPSAVRRLLPALALGATLCLLAGCHDESYPADLHYPLRSDPLVTVNLATQPTTIDRPGELGRIFDRYLDASERGKLADPAKLTGEQQSGLERALRDVFGTPARPTVKGISAEARTAVAPFDDETLYAGSQLYRQHCLHCHGLAGDGRGPTAPWVNPHPRDFRRGAFKFTSSPLPEGQRRARRDDLLRVLREGIEDASMPSFRLLGDRELDALVSYVIHLSIRGQVEFSAVRDLLSNNTDGGTTPAEKVNYWTDIFGDYWKDTQASLIRPGPYVELSPESVQRGMQLFLIKDDPDAKPGAAAAGCVSCHVDFGRAGAYRFDTWGTIGRPADLTRGVYRGGRRPIDLYWRVHSGINGTAMPATSLKAQPGEPDPIWDVVNFLLILPYTDKHARYGVHLDTTLAGR